MIELASVALAASSVTVIKNALQAWQDARAKAADPKKGTEEASESDALLELLATNYGVPESDSLSSRD